MTGLTTDEVDELLASFGWSPGHDSPLDLDASLAACSAWNGLAAAEEVHAGRMSTFDVTGSFADVIVDCPLIDSDARRAMCADAFKTAFGIGLADLRNGAAIWAGDLQ